MRHRLFGRKLGRNHHQRQALFRSQAQSMFTHGSINTTRAKALAVVPLIEKICRLCQKADLSSRRRLFAIFQNRSFVKKIVEIIGPAFKDRQGNFTKITTIKRRLGDDALIVKIEFTQPVNLKPQPLSDEKNPPKTKGKTTQKARQNKLKTKNEQ